MKIRVRRVSPTALLPTRGSSSAAGYDLYADLQEDLVIAPHTTAKIDTGLQFELPEGYFAGIFARSGIATREGLRPANCVGVCDSDYRGNYIVAIHNDSDLERRVIPHEKIAQMIVLPYLPLEFEETDDLSDTARGAGGFGSTGK
ncbi:MAG: dUTP diphosphatase [Firmicutes bacterium]|nr:dUTP diphosphatase [Bacillota bacterium]